MSNTERLYQIQQLLSRRTSTSRQMLVDELGVSWSTVKRDLEYLRNRLNAPVVWDRETRGYTFGEEQGVGPKYQLPGLWFNEKELLALATFQSLLSAMASDGPIARQLQLLMDRLDMELANRGSDAAELKKRVKLLSTTVRRDDQKFFQVIGTALVKRKRLDMVYDARGSSKNTPERTVSPQRLIYYRSNWYLAAWCHLSEGIRTFSLDSITSCVELDLKAKHLAEKELAAYYDTGYGLFGGKNRKWAKLKFNAHSARFVADEIWHPDQKGRFDKNGNYLLDVPYVFSNELLMDILRHGSDVEILGPVDLRTEIKTKIRQMASLYRKG